MDPKLASILLDFSELSNEEAEEKTKKAYIENYMDYNTPRGKKGKRFTHDNKKVVFYEDRFEHAFYTSAYKTSRQYNKDLFDVKRGCRVIWIGEIIKGNIDDTECWWVPDRNRRNQNGNVVVKRLYVLWKETYIVWLEPLKGERWKFSSAYLTNRSYIRKVTSAGSCFWRKKNIP